MITSRLGVISVSNGVKGSGGTKEASGYLAGATETLCDASTAEKANNYKEKREASPLKITRTPKRERTRI